MLEVAGESRGGIYRTIDEVAPHGDELMEIIRNDQVFYQAGDPTIPARPDSGVDTHQGSCVPGSSPDDKGRNEDPNKENQGEDDAMEEKGEKMSKFNLCALERGLIGV